MSAVPFDLKTAALRQWLAGHADQLTAETVNAFKLRAQELADGGDLNGALELLDRAAIVAEAVPDPLAEALVWRGRANALQRHERLKEALEASEKDAALCEQHGTPFDVAMARTIQVYIRGALGQFEQAIAVARWIRPHYDEADLTRGQAHLAMNLAQVYTMAWQLQAALREYDIALARYQEMEAPLEVARVQHNKGVTLELLGDLDQAESCYSQAYPVFVKAGDIFMLLKTRYNLAMLAIRRGAFEQALMHLDQARTDLVDLPDSPDRAYVDWFEAWVRKELGQYAMARALVEKALEIFQEAGYKVDTAQAHLELSELLVTDGAPSSIARALNHLEQARGLMDVREKSLLTAWIDVKQAELLLQLGRRSEAQAHAEAARDVFQEANLPLRLAQSEAVLADALGDLYTQRARKLYRSALGITGEALPLLTARCWRGMGRIATAHGDFEEAERAYGRAYEILDHLRHGLYTHHHQAGFLDNRRALVKALLRLLSTQHAMTPRLLGWIERLKASALADLLSSQPPDQQVSAELQALLDEREALRRRRDRQVAALRLERDTDLAYNLQQAPTRYRHSDHRQLGTLTEIQARLQRLEERIGQQRPPGQAWRQGLTLAPRQIQKLLDTDTIFLSYYTIGDALYALTVTHDPDGIQSYTLPTSLSTLKQRWRFLYRQILRGREPRARLSDLWQSLIAPLEGRLQTKARLLISPTRGLFNLPFAACYDPHSQRYLIERWCVQMIPSATILGYCRGQETGNLPPLLVEYPGEPDQPDYLSYVKREITALHMRLPRAEILSEQDATYENVLENAPGRNLIHIASHAHYDAQEPLASGVYLSQRRQLRASDLYLRQKYLQGTTVILSACSSGRGRSVGWDILGLNSAFLYAGAVGIVGGLWQVDDQSTMHVMTTLYEHLLGGEETAQALRHAQLTLLRDGVSPYHWGAFILYGDSRVLFPSQTPANG